MSIRAQLMSFLIRRTIKKPLEAIADDVAGFREQMANAGKMSPKIPEDVMVEPVDAGGIPCEWVSKDMVQDGKAILYLHGGGYVFGNLDGYRDLAWRLSAETGVRVLIADYRLAPEYPFPAAVEDATACIRWLMSQEYDPSDIVIGGDSAGGGLAVATMVNLKNLGIKQPAGAFLLSPWVDLACSGDSMAKNAKEDCMLSPVSLNAMADLYLGEHDHRAPLASPLFADLSGLPPSVIHVGSTEVLLSDSERLADKFKAAGGESVLEIWPKMPHVFPVFAARIPEGKQAIEKIGEFVKTRLSQV